MKKQTDACGCCQGIERITPMSTANRPGLNQLLYRVGTHATFFETMLARLCNLYIEELDEQGKPKTSRIYPLQELKTRLPEDPAVALLDAWATTADVLTFYQERIANEGYLRTATERRSVLELARLTGYRLRPGVSSSVFLAYTLDENSKDEVVIPEGARAQSVPGPGELPQSFETSEDLKARAKWNNLKPRQTQPLTSESILRGDGSYARIYLKGISTNLKPNDPLLIQFPDKDLEFHRVREVKPDPAADRTLVLLQATATRKALTIASKKEEQPEVSLIKALTLRPSVQPLQAADAVQALAIANKEEKRLEVSLIKALTLRPSVQPQNSLRLSRETKEQFRPNGETGYATVSAFSPVLRETLATAKANAEVISENPVRVYALRVTAPLFGSNAPRKPERIDRITNVLVTKEWELQDIEQYEEVVTDGGEYLYSSTVFLDAGYDKILSDSWIVVDTSAVIFDTPKTHKVKVTGVPMIAKVRNPKANIARAAYGISGKTTRIELVDPNGSKQWWFKTPLPDIKVNELVTKPPSDDSDDFDDFQIIRRTLVYAQSEELELAEEPMEASLCGGSDDMIELDAFYEGLEPGRWVVISGEREIEGTAGVWFSELAMIGNVEHKCRACLPGDKIHTFVKLAKNLQYCFKRETVTIYGNVVKATHGETRKEVLGSGDGAKALQSFPLKQPPLTFVSASNPSGVDSTLKLYVNDVRWHETNSLAGLSPGDRNFITKTDDEGKTTVTFGNGREGARLPTGTENIRAEYRIGIGKPGNAKAEQITLLATRPLGVKAVVNPLRASGGADSDSRDQARKNAPLVVKALDRLVSVQDYEDFARTYAGIGKAYAAELSDGRRQVIHVTVAGTDDIPIDETSDLFINLRQALRDYGDPFQPIMLAVRELMLIVISARVRILPDYQWEPVATQLRATLLESFSFERRELGQDVLLSEVISIIQAVRGVAYVDVDVLGGIPEKKVEAGERRLLTPEEIAEIVQNLVETSQKSKKPESRITVNLADYEKGEERVIRPAQLAFLTHEVPATLILNQMT